MNNTGLLVSQIGYDLRAPMRAIYRGKLPEGASFCLQTVGGETLLQKPMQFWGTCWQRLVYLRWAITWLNAVQE